MVILAPDGRTLADRTIQPMTTEQVKWFMDPVVFLHNVPHLWTLKLRVYCRRCWLKGLADDLRIDWRETDQAWMVGCECSRIKGKLSLRAILAETSTTDELLHKLGWSLCCTGRCAKEAGMGDGVEGQNDPMDSSLSIRCGCTDRRYVLPTGGAA